MENKDFVNEIKKLGKRDGVNPGNVLRNYYLGPAASVLSQILKEYKGSKNHVFIGAVAGASLRYGSEENWQRSTNDVDLQRVNLTEPFFKAAMVDLAIELRDLIKKAKGNNFFKGKDIAVESISIGPSAGFENASMQRGKLNIPMVSGLQPVKVSVEATSYDKGIFEEPKLVMPSHPYKDRDIMNLTEIPVVTLNNYIANKVIAFLNRVIYVETGAKASRIKDLFDIWFLLFYSGIEIEDISSMFTQLLSAQKLENHSLILKTANQIAQDPEGFFRSLAREFKEDIPSANDLNEEQVFKYFTSGAHANFKYPSILELSQAFAYALEKAGFKK
jgi:hypothetical protein